MTNDTAAQEREKYLIGRWASIYLLSSEVTLAIDTLLNGVRPAGQSGSQCIVRAADIEKLAYRADALQTELDKQPK